MNWWTWILPALSLTLVFIMWIMLRRVNKKLDKERELFEKGRHRK